MEKPQIWVFMEHRTGVLHDVGLELLGKARELAEASGSMVTALLLGANVAPLTDQVIAHGADTVLIAEEDGVPVGFASLRILPQVESGVPHAELADLFVDETRRRRGTGRALVALAEDFARRRGCRSLELTVGFDNDGARAFYRAAGFSDFALTMKKALEARP